MIYRKGSALSLSVLFSTISRSISEVMSVAYMTNRTRSLIYARLWWLCAWTPRRVSGVFRFPFGQIHYVDALSLLGQYVEIFIGQAYDVLGLSDTPHIVDCGGNIGLSVIWFKRRFPRARVVVFEADPTIASVLEENIRNLHLENVQVVRAAVTGDTAAVGFVPDGADGGRVIAGEEVSVKSVRLSDMIEEAVDILKIDIEGSEYDVIEDLCDAGKVSLVRNIVCELHGRADTQAKIGELWNKLTAAGFRLTVTHASVAEHMPGPRDSTPFSAVHSPKFLLQLYAWRPESDAIGPRRILAR